MNKRGMAYSGLGVLVAATLALTGCGPAKESGTVAGGGGTGATAEKPASAVLAAASTKLNGDTFKVTMKAVEPDNAGTVTMTGVTDPAKRLSELTMTIANDGQSMKVEMRMLGTKAYLKMSGIPGMGNSGMWYSLNVGQKLQGLDLSSMDVSKMAGTLEQAQGVQRVDAHTYKGTLDLAKQGDKLGVSKEDLARLSVSTLPFTATVDDQGRLVHMLYDLPAAGANKAQKVDLTFSDFGVPVNVTAPPADQVTTMPGQ